MSDLRLAGFTVSVACLAFACTPARPAPSVYEIRLRLPLAAPRAARCEADCRERSVPDDDGVYLECVAACPDAEVDDGVACAPADVPPRAICERIEVRDAPQEDGSVLLEILGAVAKVGVRAAADAVRGETAPRRHKPVHTLSPREGTSRRR